MSINTSQLVLWLSSSFQVSPLCPVAKNRLVSRLQCSMQGATKFGKWCNKYIKIHGIKRANRKRQQNSVYTIRKKARGRYTNQAQHWKCGNYGANILEAPWTDILEWSEMERTYRAHTQHTQPQVIPLQTCPKQITRHHHPIRGKCSHHIPYTLCSSNTSHPQTFWSRPPLLHQQQSSGRSKPHDKILDTSQENRQG